MINIGHPISKNDKFSEITFYNKSLFETEHFKVIPSLGSLVEGWVMIVPKEFYISFGAIANSAIYNELDDLIQNLGQVIKMEFGDFVIFEHGPVVRKSLIGCSVDYAHLHFVPARVNL